MTNNLKSKTKIQIKRDLANLGFKFSSLLASPDANPKIKKGLKLGVMTFVMHLAEHKKSGFNVCADASLACISLCLGESGNPVYKSNKDLARIARTQSYFRARPLFLELLRREILCAIRYAASKNFVPAFRLNGTSDIRWESVYLPEKISVIDLIIANNGECYDYTKGINRHTKKAFPKQYGLTYSWSGDNESKCIEAFTSGLNIAIPFSTKRNKPLPKYFKLGTTLVPVFDGDNDNGDYRLKDPSKCVVGLRLKYQTGPDASRQVMQLSNAINSGFCIDAVNDIRIAS